MYNKLGKLLYWIDNNINHRFIDRFFNLFPNNRLMFWVWNHTTRAFCIWVCDNFD
jgi:hypothetical protein